ncbi:hypothetical protein BDP27DRAFT_1335825 [Rhodocollybia butyracea]|uniref:F-box domain-containing protein n=1 Tax=Rhodocollybia butyracea TaxID=206335 RepID=A0A9P5PGL3_9AGAR|nr:hypothetical protein BDP27DRAFT_1335825 [Rhodocollybia butyracea]
MRRGRHLRHSNSDFPSKCLASFALDISINTAKGLTLDLSQVCSVWREIVQARPSLWSSIFVDLSHRNGAFKIMEHYLNLSRDAPLTLFITAGDLDQPSDENGHRSDEFIYGSKPNDLKEYSWETLDILFLSSRRWKDVTMNFAWAVFIEMSYRFDFDVHCFGQLVSLILVWER